MATLNSRIYSKVPTRQFNLNGPTMFWVGKKKVCINIFCLKKKHI